MSTAEPPRSSERSFSERVQPADCRLFWLLLALALFVFFYQLGSADLFEPDEGRNAEKAREIFLTGDWITPHENFFPVLDKPMFFYWLIAIFYGVFGVSEWAARLPSALAGFGCFVLVYRFALIHWGRWEALWSGLILITSLEFFILSRVVIFDMSLTFCMVLALYSFYEAAHADTTVRRKLCCALLYGSLATGTLIKGLIGLVIPALVIVFYVSLTRQWPILRRLHLFSGALVYLAIVTPWYVMADARNAGFLRYYLWQEHFARFGTAGFDRLQPWYFFLGVLFVGFLPWSTLLPVVIKRHWRRSMDDKTVFILLWAVVPLIFFSLSSSKLPHYILPIFPALALLTATTLVALFQTSQHDTRRLLAFLWCVQGMIILYVVTGLIWPGILPEQIRQSASRLSPFIYGYGMSCVLLTLALLLRRVKQIWQALPTLYALNALGMVFFIALVAQMKVAVSRERSASELAKIVAGQNKSGTQVVFFDTYLSGMPFYLGIDRPLWIVTHANKKKTVLGNFYVATKQAWPDTRWGKALFDFDEFREIWNKSSEPLLIIVKQKNLPRMEKEVGALPRMLTALDEYVLLYRE